MDTQPLHIQIHLSIRLLLLWFKCNPIQQIWSEGRCDAAGMQFHQNVMQLLQLFIIYSIGNAMCVFGLSKVILKGLNHD